MKIDLFKTVHKYNQLNNGDYEDGIIPCFHGEGDCPNLLCYGCRRGIKEVKKHGIKLIFSGIDSLVKNKRFNSRVFKPFMEGL